VAKSHMMKIRILLMGALVSAFILISMNPSQARVSDNCSKIYYQQVRHNFFGAKKMSKTYFYVCKDGSISFEQPKSAGFFGWEGKCGETAISNVLKMTCGMAWNPAGTIDRLTSDFGPGNQAPTVVYGLNRMAESIPACSGIRWTYYNTADSRQEFIESIHDGLDAPSRFYRQRDAQTKIRRAPVPALIYKASQKILHWVTVVDVIGYEKNKPLSQQTECKVIYNDWDVQHTSSCNLFAGMAEAVDSAYYVGGWFLGKFVRIKQD
jgi:hypothetical protein